MTAWQAFIIGCVVGFFLLSMTVETKKRGISFVQPPMIGATFIGFDCRGCMGEDHRFMWIGVGECFSNDTHDPRAMEISIRILKRANVTGDSRDQDLGHEHFNAADGSIQLVAPGLYMVFR